MTGENFNLFQKIYESLQLFWKTNIKEEKIPPTLEELVRHPKFQKCPIFLMLDEVQNAFDQKWDALRTLINNESFYLKGFFFLQKSSN